MNDDLISKQTTISVIAKWMLEYGGEGEERERNVLQRAAEEIKGLPSAQPERKKGKWVEKHHAYSDEESVIEEWQSCRCSECGRYDTRPYMYYFDEPNYCSYCGAKMHEEKEE